MKKFLTVTTFCLAIAAVASTKANSRLSITAYTDAPNGTCTIPHTVECTGTGTACLDGSTPVFQLDNQNPCSVPVEKAN